MVRSSQGVWNSKDWDNVVDQEGILNSVAELGNTIVVEGGHEKSHLTSTITKVHLGVDSELGNSTINVGLGTSVDLVGSQVVDGSGDSVITRVDKSADNSITRATWGGEGSETKSLVGVLISGGQEGLDGTDKVALLARRRVEV